MRTKAYRRFIQRIEYYDSDLELCDLLIEHFLSRANTANSVSEDLGSTRIQHPNLGRRVNSKQSRKIVGYHLKHTLLSSFVKDLFEDFSEFIADTMTRAALKGIDPARFVGDVKLDLHATDLLASGNWESAVKLISDAIFRKLENERKTKDLIKRASVRLGLQIDQQKLDAAMPYLDARHMLVHRDGRIDEQYRRDYVGIRIKAGKIIVDQPFAVAAKRSVTALALDIDERVVASDLVRPQDMDGQR